MRDRGSMLVLVVMVGSAITVATMLVVLPVLGELHDRQQARSAADAAALAGVTGGQSAAISLASANDATLVTWSRSGRTVTVRVRVGYQEATARATDGP